MSEFHGDAQNVAQVGSVGGDFVFHGAPPLGPAWGLEADVHPFADRETVLEALSELAVAPRPPGRPGVAVLHGQRGIGKTATATHWAHANQSLFPDGILSIDLAGAGSREELGPSEVLRAFLPQLRVTREALPGDYPGLLATFRSRVAERKVLVIFENVRYAWQVRELLPPSGRAMAIVTTDRDLSDLIGAAGAAPLPLGPWEDEVTRALLAELIGAERAAAEPGQLAEAVRFCAGWPLVIRLLAGRLAAHPTRPIGRVLRGLAAAQATGEELSVVESGVYDDLPAPARRAYRLLALHPGGADRPGDATPGRTIRFGLAAAAALLDVPEPDAQDLLDLLVDVRLLDEDGDRCGFHGLIRAHARRRAELEETEQEREAAVGRVLRWYLRAAVLADTAVNPHRAQTTFGPLYRELAGQRPFTEKARALDWLEAEHRTLAAVVHAAADRGLHDLVWQLCEALWSLYYEHKHYDEWIATHERGRESAWALADPRAEFRVGVQLGRALYETRRFTRAREVLGEAYDAARRIRRADDAEPNPVLYEATAVEFIGRSHLDEGEPPAALEHLLRALALATEGGRDRSVAINLHHLARVHLAMGELDAATEHLDRAAALFAGLGVGDDYNRARVLHTLGQVRLRAGLPALGVLEEALAVMRAQRRTYHAAEVLRTMSEAAERAGDQEAARAYRAEAIEAYAASGSAKADELGPI